MIGGEWKRAKGATKSPLGEFLIERPPLAAGSCLSLLFFQFSLTAYMRRRARPLARFVWRC